jgi:hypothetical protein
MAGEDILSDVLPIGVEKAPSGVEDFFLVAQAAYGEIEQQFTKEFNAHWPTWRDEYQGAEVGDDLRAVKFKSEKQFFIESYAHAMALAGLAEKRFPEVGHKIVRQLYDSDGTVRANTFGKTHENRQDSVRPAFTTLINKIMADVSPDIDFKVGFISYSTEADDFLKPTFSPAMVLPPEAVDLAFCISSSDAIEHHPKDPLEQKAAVLRNLVGSLPHIVFGLVDDYMDTAPVTNSNYLGWVLSTAANCWPKFL